MQAAYYVNQSGGDSLSRQEVEPRLGMNNLESPGLIVS